MALGERQYLTPPIAGDVVPTEKPRELALGPPHAGFSPSACQRAVRSASDRHGRSDDRAREVRLRNGRARGPLCRSATVFLGAPQKG